MRAYVLAMVSAALFALPTSAFSQAVEFGAVSKYILTIATADTEPTEVNVENCGWPASTRKS
jgi:hypothetical protein